MGLESVYIVVGLTLVIYAIMTVRDKHHKRRWGTSLFWLLYGCSFIFGSILPDFVIGLMVIILTIIAATGMLGSGFYQPSSDEEKKQRARQFGNKLFIPAAVIPIVTFLWAKLMGNALEGLGIASMVALAVTLAMTRGSIESSFQQGRRQLDAIGWAAILSQFLAALGYLFGAADVGSTVSTIVAAMVNQSSQLATVAAYCLGMAAFTVILGNTFAAFAVITAGIGIPMVIVTHGGDPAIVGVLGMLSGYCGTLLTPMAANFNVVPAALLELDNKYHVVKVQAIPALALLLANIILMYTLAF
ncbi:DUF979 domain-containing protein [Endozoicomonas sp. Mp262]|uniref:DUF979 domain-containing protein n=1 Tax=Endozoicomonas sp. Mp262 TaxID=2919499 RepID=UPI0021D980BB